MLRQAALPYHLSAGAMRMVTNMGSRSDVVKAGPQFPSTVYITLRHAELIDQWLGTLSRSCAWEREGADLRCACQRGM